MANKPANAAQKKWMADIASFIEVNGLHVLYGAEYLARTDFQLHHVLGRSAKHNKIAIGHWFIIPVPFELHDINEKNDLNVSYFKHNFTDKFGLQSEIFSTMIRYMKDLPFKIPSDEVYNSIMDTRS